jgi:hypothetical protein
VKLGGREYPTPLVLGGGAVVVVLAGVQLLRGGPKDEPAPAVSDPTQGLGQGGSATGDGGDEYGQIPPGGVFPSAGGSGWWDPSDGGSGSGGINQGPDPTALPPTPIAPTPAAPWWASVSKTTPPTGTTGWVSVHGAVFFYSLSNGRITGRTQTSATTSFAAYVSGPIAYPWTGHGTYALLKVLTGPHTGVRINRSDAAITRYVRKP